MKRSVCVFLFFYFFFILGANSPDLRDDKRLIASWSCYEFLSRVFVRTNQALLSFNGLVLIVSLTCSLAFLLLIVILFVPRFLDVNELWCLTAQPALERPSLPDQVMSGYPQGHPDDGYGHQGYSNDAYYQDEQHGYYDANDYSQHDGYYDQS